MEVLTDDQCIKFLRLGLSPNELMRHVFKAGVRHGLASEKGAIGIALRELEQAVRANKIGCIYTLTEYDPKGKWKHDSFITVQSALNTLDEIRKTVRE